MIEKEPGTPADSESVIGLQELEKQLFVPLTSGVYLPGVGQEGEQPAPLREPYISAYILSDASADDLAQLGVKVRSQAGDIFTGFVPLSSIPQLEDSPAIRFIELARPLFPTLDQAVPFAQIDTLHAAIPAVDGTGVIVGVVDSTLDIYHPDFRTAANATRVLFLWDQNLIPQGTEAGPPTDPTLPGFLTGGVTYGVEYDQAGIDAELTNYVPSPIPGQPPTVPAYQTVRHGSEISAHGTHVAGIAAGNGLGQGGTFTGAAPGSGHYFCWFSCYFGSSELWLPIAPLWRMPFLIFLPERRNLDEHALLI